MSLSSQTPKAAWESKINWTQIVAVNGYGHDDVRRGS